MKYNLLELHVSLTNGLFRYESWGYPVNDAPAGAEVWARFHSNLNSTDVDHQWKELCYSLSGLLCASLNFIDSVQTVSPEFVFPPTHSVLKNMSTIRYATLPREIVCTENLTPWRKLLPCSNLRGFDTLLNADHIYSNYHSLGIHIRTLHNSKTRRDMLEIKQTGNFVFDKHFIDGLKEWSVRKLFGQGLLGTCPFAKSSKLYLDMSNSITPISIEPTRTINFTRGGTDIKLYEYDIKEISGNNFFNLAIFDEKSDKIPVIQPPPIYANRFISGVGQENGKIITKIYNSHWGPISLVILEKIPWFVPIYLHTLKIRHGNKVIKPNKIQYIPGRQRERPHQLEIAFIIPSRSSVELSIEFHYIFLKWLEYPPDANHGFYIGSSVILANLPVARNVSSIPVDQYLFEDGFERSSGSYIVRIYTGSLLLTLPTPDFSMPYNVICLACTVVALAFGPIHNFTTKRIILQRSKKLSLRDKLKSLFAKSK